MAKSLHHAADDAPDASGPFEPERLLTFIESSAFRGALKVCRLTDGDLFEVQTAILVNPKAGAPMQGTGGVRKLRFSPSRAAIGKSGAYRVLYCYFQEFGVVLFVTMYPKGKSDNISMAGRKAMRKMIEQQYQLLSRGAL